MGPTLRVTPVLTQDKVLKAERGGLSVGARRLVSGSVIYGENLAIPRNGWCIAYLRQALFCLSTYECQWLYHLVCGQDGVPIVLINC